MAGRRVPRTAAFNEADVSDKSFFLRHRPRLPARQVDEAYRQRLESLLSVDDAVARVLRALRATGEAGNTLVIFTSDNGFVVGQHRWYHKILGYEESVRVPLLLRGPGVPAGVRRRQVVSLADVTATVVDAAGARAALPADGLSLLPLARDAAVARRRVLLLEAGGWPYPKVHRLYTGVRTADDKVLLRWWTGYEEVYDLHTDPYQLRGRVSAAERGYVGRLRAALRQLRGCAGAACSAVTLPSLGP